jgi:16S rRNA processing protein RimM
MSNKVCLGVIVGVHGVKGLMRVKSYTEIDSDILSYGILENDSGDQFEVKIKGKSKGTLLVEVEGVTDRNIAESLKGTKLFISRDALPAPQEEEFYYSDLVDLSVYKLDGSFVGRVIGVHDFGAGDLIDISLKDSNQTVLVPFTREIVTEIDLENNTLTIDPMPGLIDDDDDNLNEKMDCKENGF